MHATTGISWTHYYPVSKYFMKQGGSESGVGRWERGRGRAAARWDVRGKASDQGQKGSASYVFLNADALRRVQAQCSSCEVCEAIPKHIISNGEKRLEPVRSVDCITKSKWESTHEFCKREREREREERDEREKKRGEEREMRERERRREREREREGERRDEREIEERESEREKSERGERERREREEREREEREREREREREERERER
eukprot:jgi/Botrbrau1/15834/Bobra.40_1s0019.1